MARVLKVLLGAVVALALVVAFAVFVLQIPMPWQARPPRHKSLDVGAPRPEPIKLVDGQPNTIEIPESVRRAIGIRQGDRDIVVSPTLPVQKRPLRMQGSTALDPARIMRLRARFAPAEAVHISELNEKKPAIPSMNPLKHEVRMGDEVTPGMDIATFYSPDVGNKKNDLFEAIVQLRLDEVILKKAEDARGSLPDIYLWTARRNVDTDRSTVRRAKNTLLTWGIDADEIAAVVEDANKLKITDGKREELSEKAMTAREANWAKVVLKAPEFVKDHYKLTEQSLTELRNRGLPEELAAKIGKRLSEFNEFMSRHLYLDKLTRILGESDVERFEALLLKHADVKVGQPAIVVERNLAKGEVVVDNTVNLFTLARIDQMLVYANCPEDLLKELDRLRMTGMMKWTVETAGADNEGVEGTISDIGVIIDPNQHTAVIKGYIPNPEGRIRAGQFATATVELLPLEDVVEIPATALVEDGRQSTVFVQTDAAKQRYQMRRVEVVSRLEKSVLVRSKEFAKHEQLTPEEKNQDLLPRTALKVTDQILVSGVLELRAAVAEMEASRRSEEARRSEEDKAKQ